jgi:hypothetical protein
MEDDLFPLLVYEFDEEGQYGQPSRLENDGDLRLYFMENLKKILDEKRELRITDTEDLMCYHVKDGKIIYDGKEHH